MTKIFREHLQRAKKRHLIRLMRRHDLTSKKTLRNDVKQKDKYKLLCMDLWLFKGCAVVFLISNFIATSAGCEATSGTHSCCIIQMPAYKMRIQVGSWVRGGCLAVNLPSSRQQVGLQPTFLWELLNYDILKAFAFHWAKPPPTQNVIWGKLS